MHQQVRLLPRGGWIALPMAIILSFVFLAISHEGRYLPTMLGFIAPLVTAAAVGFIYGPENDPGLDSFPTFRYPSLHFLC
jgi:hypothetical protein